MGHPYIRLTLYSNALENLCVCQGFVIDLLGSVANVLVGNEYLDFNTDA